MVKDNAELVIDEYEQPNPQCVGTEFVKQYYITLSKAPLLLFRFYTERSYFFHGEIDSNDVDEKPVIGQKAIYKKISSLQFNDCQTKIKKVDSQPTMNNGIVLQVCGEISNNNGPMRKFMQTFVLGFQRPKTYFVINDIFRYQDCLKEKRFEVKDHKNLVESHPNSFFSNQPSYQSNQQHQQTNHEEIKRTDQPIFQQEPAPKSVNIENEIYSYSHGSPNQGFSHNNNQSIKNSNHPANWDSKPITEQMHSPIKPANNNDVNGMNSGSEDGNWDIDETTLVSSFENLNNKPNFNEFDNANQPRPQITQHQQQAFTAKQATSEDQGIQEQRGSGAPKTYAQLVKKANEANDLSKSQQQKDIFNSFTQLATEEVGLNHINAAFKGVMATTTTTAASPPEENTPSLSSSKSDSHDGRRYGPPHSSTAAGGGPPPPSHQSNYQRQPQHQRPFNNNNRQQSNSYNNYNNRSFGNKQQQQQSSNASTPVLPNNEANTIPTTPSSTSQSSNHPNNNNNNVQPQPPPPSISYPDNHQIFVGNLPLNMSDVELRKFFSEYGKVVDLKIIPGGQKGGDSMRKVPNYGFVIFSSPDPVRQLMSEKPITFKGHRLNVEEKKNPRSGGSGGPYNYGNSRPYNNDRYGGNPSGTNNNNSSGGTGLPYNNNNRGTQQHHPGGEGGGPSGGSGRPPYGGGNRFGGGGSSSRGGANHRFHQFQPHGGGGSNHLNNNSSNKNPINNTNSTPTPTAAPNNQNPQNEK